MEENVLATVADIVDKVKTPHTSRFLPNLGWLGLAELCIRVSRLVATVFLARILSPYDYGMAALVLTTHEFVHVFTQNGIWDKLVQTDEGQLAQLCQTAYCLNWLVCGALCLCQCLVAFPIAWFYQDTQVIGPICAMAVVYLMLPVALVQAALSQRENRLHVMALANGLQVCIDNLLAIVLAWCGFGMWAIILPKIVTAPIWVVVHFVNHPWRPTMVCTFSRTREILHFGKHVFGVKLLATLRNNLDYVIVGGFLGLESLGLYYFAFNAGLGLSMSIIKAVDAAIFPHLCEARYALQQFRAHFFGSLKTITWMIVPLVVLQTCLAPWYVPLIFGAKWTPAVSLLMLICLSAIPRPYANAASKALWALNKPSVDLRWSTLFTASFAVALLVGMQWHVIGVATAVLTAHVLPMPFYTLWVARRYVLRGEGEGGR
jgi:PST family polysaccharide transporter